MRSHRASRPAPIKQIPSSGFVGMLCPVCEQNCLGINLKYPFCHQCRQKYHLYEELLKTVVALHFTSDQETIDWQQKPHPILTGRIMDEIRWKAQYVLSGWVVELVGIEQIEEKHRLAATIIHQYLDKKTPPDIERVRLKQTRIRRYWLLLALGSGATATLVTASYLLKRQQERRRQEEAESALAESGH